MQNVWLKRAGRRRVVRDLNRILKRFAGYSTDPMEDLIAEMRKEVLRYFKTHQDDMLLFVANGTLDYRFNITHNRGKIVSVEFESLN